MNSVEIVKMLRGLIDTAGVDRLFYVEFYKADGSLRRMVCLKQSPDGPPGEGRSVGDATHDLVFDVVAQGYRTVDLSKTRFLAVGVVTWRVRP